MDISNIENFVRFGDSQTVSKKAIFGLMPGYVLFGAIVFYAGVHEGGIVLGVAYLYAAVLVAYFIALFICFFFLDESKYRTRFIRISVASTFAPAFFLLVAVQYAMLTSNGNLYATVFVLLILLEVGVSFAILQRSIKRGSYSGKNKKNEGIVVAATWGASVSLPLSRFIFGSVDKDIALLIAMYAIYLVACLAALGNLNYLKLYYIRKYGIKELAENEECQGGDVAR
jgi:hypothetical protein